MPLLEEHFQGPSFDSRLASLNPPPSASFGVDGLTVETATGSDFSSSSSASFPARIARASKQPPKTNCYNGPLACSARIQSSPS